MVVLRIESSRVEGSSEKNCKNSGEKRVHHKAPGSFSDEFSENGENTLMLTVFNDYSF